MAYIIKGDAETRGVSVNGIFLRPEPSQKLINHSPDGFNWGYGGSGPSQLALAICLLLCANKDVALERYQDLKWNVIAKLKQGENFEIELGEEIFI